MKENKKEKIRKEQTPEQKLEIFASMLDKSILSYPSLMKRSFISGIFTGLGATVGVALIFIILTFLFQILGEVPFVGTYAQLFNTQLQDLKPGKK